MGYGCLLWLFPPNRTPFPVFAALMVPLAGRCPLTGRGGGATLTKAQRSRSLESLVQCQEAEGETILIFRCKPCQQGARCFLAGSLPA